LSHSGRYLWASTRSRNATETGYISVFSVGSSGKVGERLFLKKSTGTGGAANAVRPSDWDDRWVANTDSALGVVEVWEFDGKTARVVASLGIRDTGCCATAVWYD